MGGEEIIVPSDIVTCSAKFTRVNLEEGETSGLLQSLYYPYDLKEKWYLFITHDQKFVVIDDTKKKLAHQEKLPVIMGFETSNSEEREVYF